jgi:hypothetical protein
VSVIIGVASAAVVATVVSDGTVVLVDVDVGVDVDVDVGAELGCVDGGTLVATLDAVAAVASIAGVGSGAVARGGGSTSRVSDDGNGVARPPTADQTASPASTHAQAAVVAAGPRRRRRTTWRCRRRGPPRLRRIAAMPRATAQANSPKTSTMTSAD